MNQLVESMTMTEKQYEDFAKLAKPLMQWMSDNCHPHVKAIVDSETTEFVEGIACVPRVDRV